MIGIIGSLIGVSILYLFLIGVGFYGIKSLYRIYSISMAESFFLVDRDVNTVVGSIALTATMVGGFYLNVVAEDVYLYGIIWCQIPFAYAFSLVIGGFAISKIIEENEYTTMFDPFKRKYGVLSPILIFPISLFHDICWSALNLYYLGAFFAVIFNVNSTLPIIICACAVIMYTCGGGLHSIHYTSIIQMSFIFVGMCIAAGATYFNPDLKTESFHEGFTNLTTSKYPDWIGQVKNDQWGYWLDGILIFTFGKLSCQTYYQNILSCSSRRKALSITIISSLGCLVIAVPSMFIGLVSRYTRWDQNDYGADILEFDAASNILSMAFFYLCPEIISLIGLGVISCAVMSSIDACLLSSGTLFTWNIYKDIFRKKASDNELVWVARISMLLIGISATVLTCLSPVIVLANLAIELLYVVVFPQLLSVLYIPKSNIWGFLSGFTFSVMMIFCSGIRNLGIKPLIHYPWYDEEFHFNKFPVKTVIMISSLLLSLCVSYVTSYIRKTPPTQMHERHDNRRFSLNESEYRKNSTYNKLEQDTMNQDTFSYVSYTTTV